MMDFRNDRITQVRRRRLFTFLSAVSLLLCVAACLFWARSYRVQDKLHLFRRNLTRNRCYTTDDHISSMRGRIVWEMGIYDHPPEYAEAIRRGMERQGLKDFDYD